jgi:hypothetical protein
LNCLTTLVGAHTRLNCKKSARRRSQDSRAVDS